MKKRERQEGFSGLDVGIFFTYNICLAQTALVKSSGLTKHSEIRDMLQRDLGLGYGDTNTYHHAG